MDICICSLWCRRFGEQNRFSLGIDTGSGPGPRPGHIGMGLELPDIDIDIFADRSTGLEDSFLGDWGTGIHTNPC